MDLTCKAGGIFLIRHTMLNQLRITGDRGQRGLQFMGYIGGKLLSHPRTVQNIRMLLPDRCHKRTQFFIRNFHTGLGKIFSHFIDRFYNTLCEIIGQHNAECKQDHTDA